MAEVDTGMVAEVCTRTQEVDKDTVGEVDTGTVGDTDGEAETKVEAESAECYRCDDAPASSRQPPPESVG
jgi:hypothetical protein